jgi:hypothetical protein
VAKKASFDIFTLDYLSTGKIEEPTIFNRQPFRF